MPTLANFYRCLILLMNEGTSGAGRLILDSNLLLLLAVGAFELRLISSFKRLSNFTSDDFRLLRDFSSGYQLWATPHIFTEVSNLANSLPERVRAPFLAYFASVIQSFVEPFTASAELSSDAAFPLFGLTDAALCRLAPSALILTEDGRLRAYMTRQGNRAIGLAEVKQYRSRNKPLPRTLYRNI